MQAPSGAGMFIAETTSSSGVATLGPDVVATGVGTEDVATGASVEDGAAEAVSPDRLATPRANAPAISPARLTPPTSPIRAPRCMNTFPASPTASLGHPEAR